MELTTGGLEQGRQTIELAPVLDELRILIESVCRIRTSNSNGERPTSHDKSGGSLWPDPGLSKSDQEQLQGAAWNDASNAAPASFGLHWSRCR